MELWDLYTDERILTDKKMFRGTEQPEGYYRLVIHVCIFNKKGQMLIQRRQPFKKGWSGMWDISVGGHAVSGENGRMAAEREVLEELGLKISLQKIRPALTINFQGGFDDIYIVEKEIDEKQLHLQEEEVAAVKWADEKEILGLIDDGIFIPYHKSMIGLLFFLRNHKCTHIREDK